MPAHRLLFIVVLFVLNLLALAAIMISFGQPEPKGEPERITNQINADRILLQPVAAVPIGGDGADHPGEPSAGAAPAQAPAPASAAATDAVPAAAAAPVATAPAADTPAMAASHTAAASGAPAVADATPTATPPSAAPPEPTEAPEQTQLTVAAAAHAPQPMPEACILYAGLTQEQANTLEEAARLQSAAGLRAERDSNTAPTAWWVRLPSGGSREAAERRVRELREQGVTDYFIFRDPGPNQYAISLGLFSTEGAARQYLASLERKRVKGVEVSPRNGILHSLKLQGPEPVLDPVKREFSTRHPSATSGECPP